MAGCRGALVVVLVLLGACSGDDDGGGETARSAATASTTTTAADAEPGYEPRYQPGECPAALAEHAPRVRCGILTVPEDRSDPAGATVQLAVATVAAKGERLRDDPVLYLEGGPGFGGLGVVPFFLANDIAPGRDVITFDQRGTGASEPSLNCPEVDALFVGLTASEPAESENAASREAALACRRRLTEDGVDLASYDTPTSADDVEDLRLAMGVERWNVFGVSYGTQLALEVMRRHPEALRSVVLDSVSPPHLATSFDASSFVDRLERVLALLYEECAADVECAAAYPDLEADFDAMVAKYQAEPFRGEVRNPIDGGQLPIVVDGHDLVSGAFLAFYQSSLIPLLPQIVHQLLADQTTVLPVLVDLAVTQQVQQAEAMTFSVECADQGTRISDEQEAEIARLLEENPEYATFLGGPPICDEWDVPAVGEGYFDPVTSDAPTLVLAGQFDPVTPPDWSRSAADHLGDADYVELPALGHGTVFAHDCARSLFGAFIDDPDAPVEPSCVDAMGPPDFVLP